MMNHIAVALDSAAQAASMAPYLLTVAQPGTSIFFLIPTKARNPAWLQARMAALLTQNFLPVKICEEQWELEMNREKRAAEQRLKPLRLALSKEGTDTEIWIYTSSLRKALKFLGRNYPGSFAVLRPANIGWQKSSFAPS